MWPSSRRASRVSMTAGHTYHDSHTYSPPLGFLCYGEMLLGLATVISRSLYVTRVNHYFSGSSITRSLRWIDQCFFTENIPMLWPSPPHNVRRARWLSITKHLVAFPVAGWLASIPLTRPPFCVQSTYTWLLPRLPSHQAR